MRTFRSLQLTLASAALAFAFEQAPVISAQTIYNTPYPSVIRVAIRANNNPTSPILYVQTVGFEEYCEDVLPNEWMPSWNTEALKAGAIAVKMFAWYWTLHPTTEGGFTYDVDNTTNFQTFKYLSGQVATDLAVQETWNMVFVPSDGSIKPLDFRAGTPDGSNTGYVGTFIMSQWGSQYWAQTAKLPFTTILSLFYPGYQLRFV
ncbi:SpoIID/LytB domain-containing protein [Alicyclobacillus hesperidum]|uniref:SpoIID/LytB domain-containing protein n=1 Tax=Alicyclobacillus hesperidum TaxID=89784 RepID=UPI00031FE300|nr:SpoIID/LytB domain-containing protein [Alicyclobacillus hesperidum]